MKYGRFLALAVLPLSSYACVYDDDPPRRLAPDPQPAYQPAPPAQGATGGSAGTSDTPPSSGSSPAPMLVEVDTDQTMTADPGQGVGVFVEYGTGGKWHIWLTCDTAKTSQECDFTVDATVTVGTITNLDASQLAGGVATSPTPSSVHARITVSNDVRGVAFTTNPGVALTVRAALSDVTDGSFLFFVQDGKVNGGFQGKLSNPLQLQGKTP